MACPLATFNGKEKSSFGSSNRLSGCVSQDAYDTRRDARFKRFKDGNRTLNPGPGRGVWRPGKSKGRGGQV